MKILSILIITIISFSSCSEDTAKPGMDDLNLAGVNFDFYKNQEMFNDINLNRSAEVSDSFEIISVKRSGNQLDITISYYGECQVNNFDLIWDGSVMESYPCQVRLAIKRTSANCTSLSILTTEKLSVDLVRFFGSSLAKEPIIFHLINSSKTIEMVDGDNSVSTEP